MGCEERPFLLKGSLVGYEELFEVGFRLGVMGLKIEEEMIESYVLNED